MSDDRYDNHRYHNEDTFNIQSTAGAIPVRNEKGEITMQKVKVRRYVTGKKPEWAERKSGSSSMASHRRKKRRRTEHRDSDDSRSSDEDDDDDEYDEDDDEDEDEDDSDEDDFTRRRRTQRPEVIHEEDEEEAAEFERVKEEDRNEEPDLSNPRIRRLMAAKMAKEGGQQQQQQRRIVEPEVLNEDSDDEPQPAIRPGRDVSDDDSSSGDEEMDEDAIARRRDLMRQRAVAKAQIGLNQEELMAKEEEKSGGEDDEGSSEEETTDDDEDDSEEEGARLKPVFVRKTDRLTVKEREKEEQKEREAQREKEAMANYRRKDTLKKIENIVRETAIERKAKDNDPLGLNEVITDDENEENEYEAWKLRELKRLKRDREEKEASERERDELERRRNMTDEQRHAEKKSNPHVVTNKASKGKYKFMQKYYHRGAFYVDEEQDLLKRDVSAPTLEDRFDKTVLPKVMQVKNFGRSGRTKYTHLVDQDTTEFDSAWAQDTPNSTKFRLQHSGGMKPNFERPSAKNKKK